MPHSADQPREDQQPLDARRVPPALPTYPRIDPGAALRNIAASTDTRALRSSIARSDESMDAFMRATGERIRRQAAVERATLNVADATTELVQVAQAQHDAINALVAEAQASAVTELRHFRITLLVAVIAMAAAIVAAIAALAVR
jgi:hypothetical protein